MKEFIDRDPRVLDAAVEAYRREGYEATFPAIRGGTDGSRLSEKGLPTPNLFTGGHDYHSRREWVCVHDMGVGRGGRRAPRRRVGGAGGELVAQSH